jgi:hypothetical protein
MGQIEDYAGMLRYFDDAFKLAVVLAIMILFLFRVGNLMRNPGYGKITLVGISLLLFSNIIDFTDEFILLDKVFILGKQAPFHDFLEDSVGLGLGLVLFSWGLFSHIRNQVLKEEPKAT